MDEKQNPKSLEDYERLLMSNKDSSFVWIQYMAFMLDHAGIEAARKVAEKSLKQISLNEETERFNLWVAYINLENQYGDMRSLTEVVKRAVEVNDKKKIYLQLISIYKASEKYMIIEDIYKQLCKKFSSPEMWSEYLEFLFLM